MSDLIALYPSLKSSPFVNQDALREMLAQELGLTPPDLWKQLERLSKDIHKNLRSKSLDYILGLKEK